MDAHDRMIEKLQMRVNLVLDAARYSLAELQERTRDLDGQAETLRDAAAPTDALAPAEQ